MSKYSLKGILALTLCAMIWGTAFVAQTLGAQEVEPLTFNFARSIVGSLFLLTVLPLLDRLNGKAPSLWGTNNPITRKRLCQSGIICGLILTFAIFMQQLGIAYTTTGKSGFITALYIVVVPLLAHLFFHKPVGWQNWLSVAIAALGMYFICLTEQLTIGYGDLITLACPFSFALQILVIDEYIADLDGVRMSLIQFLTCTVVDFLLMFVFENPSWTQLQSSLYPILYLGIMSTGIAYTLQIVGQKYVTPILASLLMSLESVFALLSGWLYLGQSMSLREISGCGLVFAAIMLAQLPLKKKEI